MSAHSEMAMWWTPSGWNTAPAPAAYRRALSDAGFYDFHKAGYDEATILAGNDLPLCPSPRLRVRNHPDGHTLVQIDLIDFVESLFFNQEHMPAFYFDKVPGLMGAIVWQVSAELLADAIKWKRPLPIPSRIGGGSQAKRNPLSAFGDRSPRYGSAR